MQVFHYSFTHTTQLLYSRRNHGQRTFRFSSVWQIGWGSSSTSCRCLRWQLQHFAFRPLRADTSTSRECVLPLQRTMMSRPSGLQHLLTSSACKYQQATHTAKTDDSTVLRTFERTFSVVACWTWVGTRCHKGRPELFAGLEKEKG